MTQNRNRRIIIVIVAVVGLCILGIILLIALGVFGTLAALNNLPTVTPLPVETEGPIPTSRIPTSAPIATSAPQDEEPPDSGVTPDPNATCECSANVYDCEDFETPDDAQECYEYCGRVTGVDIHLLDIDADRIVCETVFGDWYTPSIPRTATRQPLPTPTQ